MIKTTKEIALIGIFTTMLIAVQLALSSIQGVEIVTVFFTVFCYRFKVVKGMIVATCYSLLRCAIFGFFPTVIVLYLVYYNLFAIVIGNISKILSKQKSIIEIIILSIIVSLLTICFTLLDDIITPLMFGYSLSSTKAYFVASLVSMIPQTICAFITVFLLFKPLLKAFNTIKL